VQQRRLQFFLVFLCGCLMVVACGVFGAMAWRLQSRVEQLDSMMLAIGKRVVGMDASMESVGSVQQALQELMVKQEATAAIQTKIDARLDEVIKTSQATPDLLVKQLDGKTQSMSKQVQAMDGRLQAQANALKTLSGQMKGLEGALGDASAVRRDMEKQQKELRDRQAADARAAKLAADRNRDRMPQYPRAPGTE
jgi:chromosome segregation ATPase